MHQKGNDPINLITHVLPNGLTLLMSVNRREPRIFTNIVVRSGSKQDPPETTGLAHYMEHMLFKGTSKIGALDWEMEKKLLQKISDLYEQHRLTGNQAEKTRIYQEIDRISIEAAQLAAANEYDKLASAIGAAATNAYTWVDQTVFVNDIPANELERWMELESERFRMMALRLFHTELETVYEEFNISQDRDVRKANNRIRATLFPSHPYGTQTTLGSADHLKNPSQVKIQEYFSTYYVPNNMGIVMAGDFDPEQVVALAEKYFGGFIRKPLPSLSFPEQPPLTGTVKQEVLGQSSPFVDIAWRLRGSQTNDPLMLSFLSSLLSNGEVGLFDQYLNQPQKVLSADCWAWYYEDYSVFGLFGRPRQGQSLEEVASLILDQFHKIRTGDFDESLMEAIINNYRLQEIRDFESNKGRVDTITEAFVLNVEWDRFVYRFDWYSKLTKSDLMAFASEFLTDNYVLTFKRQGEDPDVIKVEKPSISPIHLNRTSSSAFATSFLGKDSTPIQPQFIDYQEAIQTRQIPPGLTLEYINNSDNELCRLDFVFEMGRFNDLKLPIADIYRTYASTDRYSQIEISKAFFRLGLNFDFYTYDRRAYATLKGLNSNLAAGLELMENILQATLRDDQIKENIVEDIITKRQNARKDKKTILNRGMSAYARNGSDNPFKFRLSEEELRHLDTSELTDRINQLTQYQHKVHYFGPSGIDEISRLLQKYHQPTFPLTPIPPAKVFDAPENLADVVYFVHFPMVQVETLLVSKGSSQFNYPEYLLHSWFNEYFGYGLSSIVFQEIREAKALAYSTYAYYGIPKRREAPHFLSAFVGTQPDKLQDALPAMFNILRNMPVSQRQIENARLSILKQLESERIPPSKRYWAYQGIRDLGFRHDLRKDVYQRLTHAGPDDLIAFHQKYVKSRKFNIMVLGDRQQVDLKYLERFGEVRELALDDLFGH